MGKKTAAVVVMLIVISVFIAYFFLIPKTSAKIYVDPQATNASVNQDFTVNVYVSEITNLYAWELRLGWNSTMLDLADVTEGAFLKSGGSTFFTYKNEAAGYIVADCTLLGNVSGVNGNGILIILGFHAKQTGRCDLTLYDTTLLDPYEQVITHTETSGWSIVSS